MKTKPFNLEEALNGAKVVTRDGCNVSQLTFFETKSQFPLVGVLDNGLMSSWRKNGINNTESIISENDLFIVVEPKYIWANVYIGNNGYPYVGEYFKTEEKAREFSSNMPNYIKTIEITDEL